MKNGWGTWIVGFDFSLSAPAAVALPLDWKPGVWRRVYAWLGKPPAPKSGDDRIGQLKRYRFIADWAESVISEIARKERPKIINAWREDYGFNKNNANASKLMESGGITQLAVWEKHALVIPAVTASSARKLFLGENPREDPKIRVQDTLFNKCKAPKTWDENQADAFVVANWGLSEAGGVALALPPPKAKVKSGNRAVQRRGAR